MTDLHGPGVSDRRDPRGHLHVRPRGERATGTPMVGIHEGHHELTHHRGDPAKIDMVRKINTWHVEQFAHFLGRLKEIPEGDGCLLDHCMIAYGSGNSDGNRHTHDNLPILLAGKGGGTLKTGRHLRFPKETPVNNLWLSLLERMGVSIETLGDSTGKLEGLTG